MSKTILGKEGLSHVKVLRGMSVGDEILIPYDQSVMAGMKSEVARQNKYYRTYNQLSLASIKVRGSSRANPGFITVIRVV